MSGPEAAGRPPITVSVVSHGHDELVARLLAQLRKFHGGLIAHVVVTHNLPSQAGAPMQAGGPFRVTEIRNAAPAGFGVNHNRAFEHCRTAHFCVLNPDIEIPDASIWSRLLEALRQPGVACAYPALFNPDGTRQENEREVVTPMALVRRHVLKRGQRRVDWASAAFWLVRAEVWRDLKGFDERFFMYCEDVDFCLRLQLAGWRLARADTAAVHDASWGSRSFGLHLAWHLRSILRLWGQPPIRRYLAIGRRPPRP